MLSTSSAESASPQPKKAAPKANAGPARSWSPAPMPMAQPAGHRSTRACCLPPHSTARKSSRQKASPTVSPSTPSRKRWPCAADPNADTAPPASSARWPPNTTAPNAPTTPQRPPPTQIITAVPTASTSTPCPATSAAAPATAPSATPPTHSASPNPATRSPSDSRTRHPPRRAPTSIARTRQQVRPDVSVAPRPSPRRWISWRANPRFSWSPAPPTGVWRSTSRGHGRSRCSPLTVCPSCAASAALPSTSNSVPLTP